MNKKQLLIAGSIFMIVVTILIIGYLSFLRPNYVVLFDNMREADTSSVIAELDKEGIGYKLQDKGRKVLVSEDEVSQAKIIISASPIATGGVVGFELFNESDMGLTDFAQKINFQRALQGELARTIMAMNDIEYSRVHLSLPERSLFRADSSPPKAAVTIQTRNGKTLSSKKVIGLQQLVSSSVPNLAINNVVILDETGTALNKVKKKGAPQNEEVDERTALETYFRVRGIKVIREILPSLNFEVNVVASNDEKNISTNQSTVNLEQDEQETKAPTNDRNFKLTIIVRTIAALNDEDRSFVEQALIQALSLDLDNIDVLAFETGTLGAKPIDIPNNNNIAEQYTPPIKSSSPSTLSTIKWQNIIFSKWFLLFIAIVAIITTLFFRQRSQLNDDEHQSFADQLSDLVNNDEGYSNG